MVPGLKRNRDELETESNNLTGVSSIKKYRILRRRINKLDDEIERIERSPQAFIHKVIPLIKNSKNPAEKEAVEAFSMSIFEPNMVVPIYVNSEQCPNCNVPCCTRVEESILVCPSCNQKWKHVNLYSDHTDAGSSRQDTHDFHLRSTRTGHIKHIGQTANPYPKENSYMKFLMQFSENIPDPPDSVIDTILRKISTLHLLKGDKLQSTDVAKILNNDSSLSDYKSMPLRISLILKRIDGESIPLFSDELIQNLVNRFKCLVGYLQSKSTRSRKRVFKFCFLTRVFLEQEGRFNEAGIFPDNRTRSVVRRTNELIHSVYNNISEEEMRSHGFSSSDFHYSL